MKYPRDRLLAATLFLLGLSLRAGYSQVSLTFVAQFDGTNAAYVESALIQGRDGNIYGTATAGGSFGSGTVFELTTSGLFTNLISFDSTNGAYPQAGLIQDSAGNLCGTTYQGGSNSLGTLFRITAAGQFSSTSFSIANESPNAVLLEGANGSYYGTTQFGGDAGRGSVFRWSPADGVVTLASFDGTNGSYPYDSGLTMAADGSLYGVTAFGGIGFDSSVIYSGYGTVFKITTNGVLTTVASFKGTNGCFPVGVLVWGPSNSLYGTTSSGGIDFDGSNYSGYGTVFKVTADGNLRTLCFFDNLHNGADPFAGLTLGTDANFYGTTQQGGTNYPPDPNNGTIFQMSPEGKLTTLISFTATNGWPMGGLLQASNGDFYGTTSSSLGGAGGIFRLHVPGSSPPSVQLARTYEGLFSETSEPSYESSGFCAISGGKSSAFTGKIFSTGRAYSFSGKFDPSGNAWTTIRRSGASPLWVHLVADNDTITGEITNETWTAALLAKSNPFNSKTNPTPQAGKYTFVLPGSTNSDSQPRGDSFGTMMVMASGRITLDVAMSDGTKASQTTFSGNDGRLPFHVSLYYGKGLALGWLQLQGSTGPVPDFGTVTWFKPPLPKKAYPAGFTNQMQAVLSPYQVTDGASVLNYGFGESIFQNGDPAQAITNSFSVDSPLKISGTNNLVLKVATSSGSFRGHVLNPVTGKVVPFSGVFLQAQQVGRGFFLDGHQSGMVYLGP